MRVNNLLINKNTNIRTNFPSNYARYVVLLIYLGITSRLNNNEQKEDREGTWRRPPCTVAKISTIDSAGGFEFYSYLIYEMKQNRPTMTTLVPRDLNPLNIIFDGNLPSKIRQPDQTVPRRSLCIIFRGF